jgi:hypothetical protein
MEWYIYIPCVVAVVAAMTVSYIKFKKQKKT